MTGSACLGGQPRSDEELHMRFNDSKRLESYMYVAGKVTGDFEKGVQDGVKAMVVPGLPAQRSHPQT